MRKIWYNVNAMMKLQYKLKNFCCAMIIVVLGVFLALNAFMKNGAVFANEAEGDVNGQHFVTIYDNGSTLTLKTAATSVQEMLEKVGLTVDSADIVEPGLDAKITGDNYKVNIYRARPVLITDGSNQKYLMSATFDPRRMAKEAGFTIYDGDDIEMVFNQNFLEAGAVSTYKIIRNGGTTLTVEESLPYEIITKNDYTMPKGQQVLEQAGEDGRRISTYEVEFENGIEVKRTLRQEEVKVEAVPEIVIVGAKPEVRPDQQECAGWVLEAGIPEENLEVALDLIYRESHCNVHATNARSGAYGIPQALPGSKMQSFGDDWETNPVTQIKWMNDYVTKRYGGWRQAQSFWYQNHWY